jgi:hypothetical protein
MQRKTTPADPTIALEEQRIKLSEELRDAEQFQHLVKTQAWSSFHKLVTQNIDLAQRSINRLNPFDQKEAAFIVRFQERIRTLQSLIDTVEAGATTNTQEKRGVLQTVMDSIMDVRDKILG